MGDALTILNGLLSLIHHFMSFLPVFSKAFVHFKVQTQTERAQRTYGRYQRPHRRPSMMRSMYHGGRRVNTLYSANSSWLKFLPSRAFSADGEADCKSSNRSRSTDDDDIKRRLIGLVSRSWSATAVLQDWVNEGRRVSVMELRRVCKHLIKFQRHEHALEILKWMETQNGYHISATDHAFRLELIIKVHGLSEGEEYFAKLTDRSSQKAASLTLLHSYVKERAVVEAESLMAKVRDLGILVTPEPFNEMMKLYAATSQFQKVPSVVLLMKENDIPLNVLSYNIWMGACGEISGVASAEMVYKEMLYDKNVEVGWSTLSTLATIYIKSGFLDKATLALQKAEAKLSTSKQLGYFLLITLYASLNNKDGILRLWKACKALEGRITCSNYMCVLSCLVKIGEIREAEKIFTEYESKCRKFDVRVSNVLLGAYARSGLMERAESLHVHTLERGGCPNYKTWEILTEGWVRKQNMDKAIHAMRKGFAMLKHCDWRPSPSIVLAVAEFFEKSRNYEEAKEYLKVIRQFGLATLPVYKSMLRVYASSQQGTEEIVTMMKMDEIDIDDEASKILQRLKI